MVTWNHSLMNQLTLKLNFGANSPKVENVPLHFPQTQHSNQMYTPTSETIWSVEKGEKTKPTFVTNLLIHSNNRAVLLRAVPYLLSGASTPAFKEATLKLYFKISYIQDKFYLEFC